MSESTGVDRELDVRTIDGEPFSDIMAALDDLPDGEQLRLINSFEPEPLYGVLDERGFTFESRHVGDDEWHVVIERAE